MEKDSEIYRGKKERIKSIALKAKKESSDEETSTSESDDEEYAMAVRNFKKFFRRKGKFVRQPRKKKKSFRQRDEKKGKSDQKCFRYGDPNNLIGDCPKPSRNKDQKAFMEVLGAIAKMTPKTKLTTKLVSWLNRQMSCKVGLGFDSGKASTSGTKTMSFIGSSVEKAMDGSTIKVYGSTLPGSVCLRTCLEPDEWIKDSGSSKHMTGNKSLFSTYKAYDEEEAIKKDTKVVNNNNEEDESIEVDKTVNIKESKNHPLDQVIENLNQRTLRSQAQNHSNFFCFIFTVDPKDVKEALKDESWVVAMQEELNQFVANDVWELVPLPMSQSVIFRNKLDENGIVSKNKARLVAQGYNQQEGIDYDETYALNICSGSWIIVY
ncbi:hypothetical protein Tco_1005407 [Tanacetum coccineum]|uniref:Retrovirus-related Pol polyprotein from transposon TNT 1-94-like beta-barrel domain-containing protein n=1 Tax=Tanacetum coccineum TaxID=301880 RepID=A0ABQ5FFC6_9ASTR